MNPEIREIWDYLYALNRELQYLTTHLEEGNFTEDARENLQTIRKSLDETVTRAALQETILRASERITGNRGGYVIFRDGDEDGKPDEICVMDAPDIAQATKVWRWNAQGLGYSSQGYDGPYQTAITADGEIVADFVAAGELSASVVTAANLKAGSIQSADGETFRLDLDQGKLVLDGSRGGGITIRNAGIFILKSQSFSAANYSQADADRAQGIMLGTLQATQADLDKYDFYGDGKINLQELLLIRLMITRNQDLTVSWYAQLDTSRQGILKIWRENSGVNTGTQTLLEVSAGDVKVMGVSAPLEDAAYPGCLYTLTDTGDTEWINPPMEAGVEYRTTMRWQGSPVYQSLTKIEGLPNNGYGSYNLAATQCRQLIDADLSIRRRSDGANFLGLLEAGDWYVGSYGNPYLVFMSTKADLSGHDGYVTLRYIKN